MDAGSCPAPGPRRGLQDGVADYNGRYANPPFLFGGGGVEPPARAMTVDLQHALATARAAGAGSITELRTHGVDFVRIETLEDGDVALHVEGIGYEDNAGRRSEDVGCKGGFSSVPADPCGRPWQSDHAWRARGVRKAVRRGGRRSRRSGEAARSALSRWVPGTGPRGAAGMASGAPGRPPRGPSRTRADGCASTGPQTIIGP